MIIRLLLALAVIAALFVLLHWFRNNPPRQISQALKKAALYTVIVLLIFLAISGRLHWLYALLASLLPFVKKLLPLVRYVPLLNHWYRRYQARRTANSGTVTGQTSQVATHFIRMTLDHDSGRIDGTLLQGNFEGQRLSQLTLQQLLECRQTWLQQDQESARLLEAFLDQNQPQWREQVGDTQRQAEDTDSSVMSRDEAQAVLGLNPAYAREDVIQAHRKLMQKLHPDRGGSNYLAAKVNQAKDLLLDQMTERQ